MPEERQQSQEAAQPGAGAEAQESWQETLRGLGGGNPTDDSSKGDEGDKGGTPPGDEDGDEGGKSDEGNVTLSKDAIVAMFQEAVKTAVPQQAAPPKQYTEEELRKILNVFSAQDAHLKQLGLEPTPEKVTAFNEVLQAVAKQATSVASFELQAALEALQERLNPVLQYVQQSQMEGMKQRFFKKHNDLEGLEPIVMTAYQALKARGAKFNGEDEAFKAVAEEARAILSKLPGYNGGTRGNTRSKTEGRQSTPTRKMPSLSSGGQGGAGDSSGKTSGPKWKSVLGG